MSKSTIVGLAVLAAALAGLAGVAALRRPAEPAPPRERERPPATTSPAPIEAPIEPPSRAPAPGVRPESPVWPRAAEIAGSFIGDGARRREFLQAFVEMTGRIRAIQSARARYVVEGERTVIEIPGFREEGRAIHAEWLTRSFALLTPEERSRFTTCPEFESGEVSPELDLLQAAGFFAGSRHGKNLEPDFLWDGPLRIDARRYEDGKVQIRLAGSEYAATCTFDSQQEALNHLTRVYGHLLGPIPQLFR